MSVENVEVELLIKEVKARPVIWDVNCEDFKSRTQKLSAWEEICEILIEDFSQQTGKEKNIIIKKLVLKWKNLKDNYWRSARKKIKLGKPLGSGRQYIYARLLSFLRAPRTTQSTLESLLTAKAPRKVNNDNLHTQSQEEEEAEEEEDDDDDVKGTSLPHSVAIPAVTIASTPLCRSASSTGTAPKRQREFETSLLQFINSRIPAEHSDDDRSFFDSLIPTVKTFNEDQKLDFRCEVLQLIKRIKHQDQA